MREDDAVDPRRTDDLVDGRDGPQDEEERALLAMAEAIRADAAVVAPSPSLRAQVRETVRPARRRRRLAFTLAPVAAVAAATVLVVVAVTGGDGGAPPAAPPPAGEAGVADRAASPPAAAAAPEAAPLPATGPPTVEPGRGIGAVTLGAPAAGLARPAGVGVRVGADGRVAEVRSADPAIRTARGIGVGTPAADVVRLLPGATCTASVCRAPGIVLEVTDGRVSVVRVLPLP
jgi:hypothetical protein